MKETLSNCIMNSSALRYGFPNKGERFDMTIKESRLTKLMMFLKYHKRCNFYLTEKELERIQEKGRKIELEGTINDKVVVSFSRSVGYEDEATEFDFYAGTPQQIASWIDTGDKSDIVLVGYRRDGRCDEDSEDVVYQKWDPVYLSDEELMRIVKKEKINL